MQCTMKFNLQTPAREGYSEARNPRTARKLVYFVVMISTP